MKILKYSILSFAVFLFLALSHSAFAATIYILPESGAYNRGDTVSVDIKIDSEGEGINAAQGTLHWPAGVLEFIDASKEKSVFDFWVRNPELSGSSDALSFIAGTAKGVSGSALQVLKIRFRIIGTGTADLAVSEAAVTASDGKGTNVLSKIRGASYGVGVGVSPAAPSVPEGAPQPVRVERAAVPAKNLPQKPELQVPLYPNESLWHNRLGEVVVLWNMPSDVVAVAVTLNHSPSTIPPQAERELTTGKSLGILDDGIWYVHVQFKNNIGWGPVSHYRMAIDTKPPLPFEVSAPEGETTDNPAPVIQFKTSDSLSGIQEYQLKIDNNEIIKITAADFSGRFTLPLQEPGTHSITVWAVDKADNRIGDNLSLEILPIPSPVITFVTKELFAEEGRGLNIKGTALPGVDVLLLVQAMLNDERGEIITRGTARTDDRGNWEFTFDEPLRNGVYVISAQSRDARGALSLLVTSPEITVKSQPIIQIGALQLGRGGALVVLIIIIFVGFGGGVWFYRSRQKKIAMHTLAAENDLEKVFKLISEDVEKIVKFYQTGNAANIEFLLDKLQANIKKMEGYLKTGIDKIKDLL